jgi:hypothetical protein
VGQTIRLLRKVGHASACQPTGRPGFLRYQAPALFTLSDRFIRSIASTISPVLFEADRDRILASETHGERHGGFAIQRQLGLRLEANRDR